MSDSANINKGRSAVAKVTCCIWPGIVALVFLRLCVGWHFFSEGIKKVEYDSGRGEWKLVFTSEGFLNQAKGPLAEFFQNQAPTTHNWRESLAVSRQLDTDTSAKLAGWVESYVKRRQAEVKSGKSTEAQFAEFSPAAAWADQIKVDWQATLDRFNQIKSLSDELRKQAEAVYKDFELQLADFAAEEALAIESYQHDLWRLEQAKKDSASDEVPFKIERVAELQATVDRTPLKWAAAVKSLDEKYADQLRALLTEEGRDSSLAQRVEAAVADPEVRRLHRTDMIVTGVVIGVGIGLLWGLFTRVAAIAGAMFLLSVMATQPPWVPGAYTLVFYYQLVEFAALVFLAAVGAGRWAGLDSIIHRLWNSRRSAQGA